MNPILRIIYFLLKGLTRVALWGFYGRITLVHPERFQLDDGPYILISNHPNTLLDPLLTAVHVNRIVYFLANAGLFKTPFQNWFFSTFYCIRIERPTDVDGRPVKNDRSFVLCNIHLKKKGILYIAPEAYSFKGRKLMPLKTGTARIALSAEDQQNFNLGLKILPVGLNYQSPYDFRSDVLVWCGKSITVTDFAKEYENDPYNAVRELTRRIENHLSELIITTHDESEDVFLKQMEELLRNARPVGRVEELIRSQQILQELQHFRKEQAGEWLKKREETQNYFEELQLKGLSDLDISRPGSCYIFRRSVLALISIPFFVYGWVNNYIPAFIPAWMVRKLKLAEEYNATVKIITGLFTFPVFYWLQFYLVKQVLFLPYSWIYLISLVPMGLWAWDLKKKYVRLQYSWRFERLRRKNPDAIRSLFQQRNRLLKWVDTLSGNIE